MPPESMSYNENYESENKPVMSRREFILAMLSGFIFIPVAAKILTIIAGFASVPERSFSGAVIPTWVPAGLITDLTRAPKAINFGEDVVYVLKSKTGKPVAYSGVCTHAGCLVEYNEEENIFLCPCHGGHFNLDGEVTAGPPPRSLDQHKVKVSMGRIMIGRKIEK